MSVNYSLDSVAPIQSLSINSQDLLGIENARVKMEPLTDTYGAVNTLYLTEKLLDVAKGNNQDLTIDEDAKRIIEQIEIRYGPRSSEDSRLMLTMILPNDSFTYSDENGVHQVNPAERFVTGELSIGIKRRGDLSPGVATGPIELKADDFHLYNEKGTLLAEVESIDLSNPKTITIKSGVGQSTQSKSTKRDSAESPKSPSDNKENKWTKQWEPNQTVPLRDWWNEMVSEGHVRINSLAQSYVDDILNGGNLVPNPVEYYKNQYPLIGNCKNLLIDLRTRGKGHVTISEEAFEQIPGGNDCQVFSKNK